MSLIGKEIIEFTADAYHAGNGKFITVSNEDLKGKWSVVCFYPADFSFVCPTELEDLQEDPLVAAAGKGYQLSNASVKLKAHPFCVLVLTRRKISTSTPGYLPYSLLIIPTSSVTINAG